MNDHSFLISKTLTITYPFVLLFGLYIVLNGHVTPGGGFQGGAIIASVLILKYLIDPSLETPLKKIRTLEKITLFFIFLFPLGFLLTFIHLQLPTFNLYYLILMNLLISIKVACGLSIIFIRFVFYETR
ncbi:MnhB domain-containing protein [Fusibacter sp. 3D3]|uniref:MnhB domain-containing protein n=1 Tax=Fusibacter sp. 3D3 TaxID=1048380 RepID=UPI0008529851|nr:MnhB domain-containing protein [Fusibacter sp. 3D3]GAU77931.1 membrane bound hydrogenase MbhF subunit [Fusibacter sp. 3D3]